MSFKITVAIIVLLLILLFAAPVMSHHSFAAEFDSTKPITIAGIVTKVEWMNPHTFFYVDVKDPAGKVANWSVEMGSPNALTTRGWTRASLKVGDSVIVDGWQAKDGRCLANAKSVKFADGRSLLAASSNEEK
jgi:hypothetical protein